MHLFTCRNDRQQTNSWELLHVTIVLRCIPKAEVCLQVKWNKHNNDKQSQTAFVLFVDDSISGVTGMCKWR